MPTVKCNGPKQGLLRTIKGDAMKWKKTAIGVVAALVLAVSVSGPANAAEASPDGSMSFTAKDLDAISPGGGQMLSPQTFLTGLEELEASAAQRQAVILDGHTYYKYVLPEGSLTLPSAADVRAAIDANNSVEAGKASSPTSANALAVRMSGIKMAVGFNTVDQQALAAGAGALIAAGLCAIPGVGWLACAAIGVVVGVATTYLVANGICSRGRDLWWYDVSGGSTIACRSSAPF